MLPASVTMKELMSDKKLTKLMLEKHKQTIQDIQLIAVVSTYTQNMNCTQFSKSYFSSQNFK